MDCHSQVHAGRKQKMREIIQLLLDTISQWGTWLLVALMLLPAAGLWRLWRKRHELPRTALAWRSLRQAGWIMGLAVFIWLLEVQLAPLTRSLVTLREGRGESVPDISFRSATDGRPHRLRDFAGKVVVLNPWATYCPPCVQELPTLARLQNAYRDRGVVVIALSDEPAERVQGFLEKRPMELLAGYTDSNDWLKLEGFRPVTLIIDRQGILRNHFVGASDYAGFESFIKPYL